MTGFNITDGKGFHITFSNGVTVSVQFGSGNYCENYPNREIINDNTPDEKDYEKRQLKYGRQGASNAEVAIFDNSGKWITRRFFRNGGNVEGWVSPEKVLRALVWAEKYKEKNERTKI